MCEQRRPGRDPAYNYERNPSRRVPGLRQISPPADADGGWRSWLGRQSDRQGGHVARSLRDSGGRGKRGMRWVRWVRWHIASPKSELEVHVN